MVIRERTVVPPVKVRVKGLLACCSDPSKPTETFSFPCLTPSCGAAVLGGVHWKPEFRWQVEGFYIHNPIQYFTETRREVNDLGVSAQLTKKCLKLKVKDPSKSPTLRQYTYLYDVDYTIVASAVVKEGGADHVRKQQMMLLRRVEKGQYYYRPFLGVSQCPATVLPADPSMRPINVNRDIGMMTFGWRTIQSGDLKEGQKPVAEKLPIFFPARIERGVLSVPSEYYRITRPDWPLAHEIR